MWPGIKERHTSLLHYFYLFIFELFLQTEHLQFMHKEQLCFDAHASILPTIAVILHLLRVWSVVSSNTPAETSH